jgi:hypothetical protein
MEKKDFSLPYRKVWTPIGYLSLLAAITDFFDLKSPCPANRFGVEALSLFPNAVFQGRSNIW